MNPFGHSRKLWVPRRRNRNKPLVKSFVQFTVEGNAPQPQDINRQNFAEQERFNMVLRALVEVILESRDSCLCGCV